jgi:hypothetical protein
MLNVRIKRDELDELHALADDLGVAMGYVVRRALALGLDAAREEIASAIEDAERERFEQGTRSKRA